ncbi:hypothetical protein [Glycomyces paridis]|uniref:Uncharacterized protein n=1 Tax=Glycomyces paridis TaxID=2126555 RepID=A0A4V4HNZ3_9ACTN|nr:hypothetical protein [Glycomyces paridis]THV27926.1 hypothetical protein E9998_13120 [Glycomyces paridis]
MSARAEASRLHEAGEFHDPKACMECQAWRIAQALRGAGPGAAKQAAERLRDDAKRTAPPRAYRFAAGPTVLDPNPFTRLADMS